MPAAISLFEIAMGRRDDPRIDANWPRASQSLDLSLLVYPEQLDLDLEWQVADFVEKDRRVIGRFEAADLPLQRPGIGASFAAEQLAFDQRRRDRRAVHPDHWTAVPTTEFMDAGREQLLAAARLPEEQHRRIGRRDLLNLLLDLTQREALASHQTVAGALLCFLSRIDLPDLKLVFQVRHLVQSRTR